ncbi:Got1/Sft2-like vescicle transport protein family [Zea mays]|nr:Got1/Sft2-like vescicle transport protein family [Zea mays]
MLGCRTDVHILVNACLLQSSEIWGSIHPWQFDGPWKVRSKLLTLVAIILEFGALIWYSLSYIPFARSIVSKVMTSCFDTDF